MTDVRAPLAGVLLVAISSATAGCSSGSRSSEPPLPPAPECNAADAVKAPFPLRRLTRFEYGRTVHDLTGAAPALSALLPPDEESLGFLNIADAYSVSTLHTSKYLELAE